MKIKNISKKVLAVVLSMTFLVGIIPSSSLDIHAENNIKTESKKEETEEQKKERKKLEDAAARAKAPESISVIADKDMDTDVVMPASGELKINVETKISGKGYLMVDVSRQACKYRNKHTDPLELRYEAANGTVYTTKLLEDFGHYNVSYDSKKDMYRFYIPCNNVGNPTISIVDPNKDSAVTKFKLRVYASLMGKDTIVPAPTLGQMGNNNIEVTSPGEDEKVYEGFIFGNVDGKEMDTFFLRPDTNSDEITLNIGSEDPDGFEYDAKDKNDEILVEYFDDYDTYKKVDEHGPYDKEGELKYEDREYQREEITVGSSSSVTLPWYPKHGIIKVTLKHPNFFLVRLSVEESNSGKYPSKPTTPTIGTGTIYDNTVDMKASATRYSGDNRYDTAIKLSKKAYSSNDIAVVASGENFADALAGGALAAAHKAPLLLVNEDEAETVEKELQRLGVEKVYILGGLNSISNKTEFKLSRDKNDKMREVIRLSGADRYETSYQIYKETTKAKGISENPIIANGKSFADALSAGPLAARNGRGIILTDGHNLAGSVDKTNSANIIIGGYSSVDSSFKGSRYYGADRYETSANIAKIFYKPENVMIASGEKYPDGLSAITLYEKYEAPLLLVKKNNIPKEIQKFIANAESKHAYIIGGESSVSKDVEKAFK